MEVQSVSFAPTSMATIGWEDFALSHWGSAAFFADAIPCTDFAAGVEVRRSLNPTGITYLQAAAGRMVMLGLRTTYDIAGTPPTGPYAGVELGTPPPNIEVLIRYQP